MNEGLINSNRNKLLTNLQASFFIIIFHDWKSHFLEEKIMNH